MHFQVPDSSPCIARKIKPDRLDEKERENERCYGSPRLAAFMTSNLPRLTNHKHLKNIQRRFYGLLMYNTSEKENFQSVVAIDAHGAILNVLSSFLFTR